MKRRVLFLCLLIFFLFNLSSCSNKKEDKLVKMDCSGDFYIDELNTKYAYVFLSANRIVEYVIDNFVCTNDAKIKSYEFIEEKNSDGSFMQTKGYYEYGIVFLFEYMEFQFETFDIKINDTLKETIDLNLNVVIIPKSSNNLIAILHEPMIGYFSNNINYVVLTLENIKINEIILHDSLNLKKKIFVNSLEFEPKKYESKEKIYINIEITYESRIKTNFMYLEIKYINDNNEEFIYTSSRCQFGNYDEIFEVLV